MRGISELCIYRVLMAHLGRRVTKAIRENLDYREYVESKALRA